MILPNEYRHPHPYDNFLKKYGSIYYKIPYIPGIIITCLATSGNVWEHVAVTVHEKDRKPNTCPAWEEMCFVKDFFWCEEEAVMQLHPPKSDWISNHPYCLHLWRPVGENILLPPSTMVGLKELNGKY